MNRLMLCLFIMIVAFIFAGCFSYNTQDFEVEGLMGFSQVRANTMRDSSDIHLSGYMTSSFSSQRTGVLLPGHTKVNSRGFFEGDTIEIYYDKDGHHVVDMNEHPGSNIYSYNKNNYKWQLPKYTFGIGMEIALKNYYYLTLILNMSVLQNNIYWGWGIGQSAEWFGDDYGYRVEGGFTLQKISLNSIYWKEGNWRDYTFIDEIETKYRLGIFASLTYFTTSREAKVNYFLQSAIQWQRLSNAPRVENPFEYPKAITLPGGTIFLSLTPGIVFPITNGLSFLTGLRFVKDFQLENVNGFLILMPFAQIDCNL